MKFQNLLVWQKAIDLAEHVYQQTASFPAEEKFGLTAQMRRSALSISSNIAEGYGRKTSAEFLHFLSIARGSLCELESQIYLAERLTFLSNIQRDEVLLHISELHKMLHVFAKKIKTNS